MCRHRAPPQQLLQFRDEVLGLFHVFWEYVVLKNVVLLVNPLNRYFLSTCCLPGTTIEAEDTALDLERQSVLRCYNRRGRFPGPAKCGRMPVFSGKTIPLLFFILMKNKHTHTHTQGARNRGPKVVYSICIPFRNAVLSNIRIASVLYFLLFQKKTLKI